MINRLTLYIDREDTVIGRYRSVHYDVDGSEYVLQGENEMLTSSDI